MKKGRFGLVLCFYPIAAFVCVILKQPLIGTLLLALAVFLEKDEWSGRQTLQAWILSLAASFFGDLVPWAVSLVPFSFVSRFLTAVSTVLSILVYLAAVVFSILGILRVMKEQEADLPLVSDLAYRVYGKRRPQKAVPGQYPPPYTPQPPAGTPVQPQQQYGQPPCDNQGQTGGPQP